MKIKWYLSLVKNYKLLDGNKLHWGNSLALQHTEPYLREFCSTQLFIEKMKNIWFMTNYSIKFSGYRIPVTGGKEMGLYQRLVNLENKIEGVD